MSANKGSLGCDGLLVAFSHMNLPPRNRVGGSGLVFCDLLGHVQQKFLVVRFHFRKQVSQFGNVNGLAACASEFVILPRFQLVNSSIVVSNAPSGLSQTTPAPL